MTEQKTEIPEKSTETPDKSQEPLDPQKEIDNNEGGVAEKPRQKKKDEKTGVAYISSSSNNTIVHITDLAGSTISRISGGMITKHSRLKSSPTIGMFIAKRAAERPKDLGFTSLYVRIRGKTREGIGPGAHAAVKSLGKEGFNIISVLDTTRVPRGGPKKKGGRRGRRV